MVSAFPQVWCVCLFMHELKLLLHITLLYAFMKLLDHLKQNIKLLLASFHPWVNPHKVVDCTLPHCLQIPSSLYFSYLRCRQLSSHQSQKNTKYSQWSVRGFCLMGVKQHRMSTVTSFPLRTLHKVVDCINPIPITFKVSLESWQTLLHVPWTQLSTEQPIHSMCNPVPSQSNWTKKLTDLQF